MKPKALEVHSEDPKFIWCYWCDEDGGESCIWYERLDLEFPRQAIVGKCCAHNLEIVDWKEDDRDPKSKFR